MKAELCNTARDQIDRTTMPEENKTNLHGGKQLEWPYTLLVVCYYSALTERPCLKKIKQTCMVKTLGVALHFACGVLL